ncbi:hypothetical protein DL93DRAFT_2085733 [Clavulina sp. PMI_390]|nr:hypothetical protein DL93DRAFT_2085733 [Clavulina sp. PMI_390]
MPFRADQLVFRTREIYEAFHEFTNIIKTGSAGPTRCETDDKHDWTQWMGAVDADTLELTGHSFGGATSLAVLTAPPPPQFPALPIRHVLLLDPWVDPVPTPGPIPLTAPNPLDPSAPLTRPPLAVINSERFTLWKEHFGKLCDLAGGWRTEKDVDETAEDEEATVENGATLMTIVRARHDDFSDFPALMPFNAQRVQTLGSTIQKLSLAFLADGLAEELAKEVRHDKVVIEHKKKKTLQGVFGEVLVHAH